MVLIYRVKTLREFRVFDVKERIKEEGKRREKKKVRSDPSDVSPLDTEFELDNSDDNNWIQPRNQPEAPRSRNWRNARVGVGVRFTLFSGGPAQCTGTEAG